MKHSILPSRDVESLLGRQCPIACGMEWEC